MRLSSLALVAAAMSLPAMAVAQTSTDGTVLTNTPEMRAGFENQGQCMAAFRQLRNEQRKSGDRGGEPYNSMSNGDYNKASKTTTRCEQINGRYYVVYNANGF